MFQDRSNILNVSDGIDMNLLPPCRTELEIRIRRVNYQVFIQVHAHENDPDLLDIEEGGGWGLISDQIEYDRIKGNLIFPEQLGPVVQSVVSLTSSLRVISLTVLADSIHNILICFAEKM